LEQLLAHGENCISRKCLPYKELAIFSKSLFQNQPGFGTSSIDKIIYGAYCIYKYLDGGKDRKGILQMKKNNIFGMLVIVLGFVFVACAIGTGTDGDVGTSSQLTVTNLPSGNVAVYVDVPIEWEPEGSFTIAELSTNSKSLPFSLINKHDSAPFTGSGTFQVFVITGTEPNEQFRKKLDVTFINGSATINWNDMTPYIPG
jgi:hypothetical protein